MQNDAVTLHCPNDMCQAANRQTDKFCQRCGTPLIKRYLWAVGEEIEVDTGALWLDRYLLKSDRIFLDTKPSQSPQTPYSEVSDRIKKYLKLVPYRLQVPQVYTLVQLGDSRSVTQILLLEQAPIYPDAVPLEGQLMPELTDAWKDATSMRQLNWLWQIAQLWQPLEIEGVASSLLKPKLLRVEGSLVRLLELQLDQESAPTLAELGQLWLNLLSVTQPAIAGFLEQLCHSLIQGEVRSSEQLIALLDQGLIEIGRSQTRTLRIATRSDQGPSRQRNEDACYPPSGTTITKPPSAAEALAIVCDGIGGHEGGDVASNLAIETIHQQLQQLSSAAHLDAKTLSSDLEDVTCDANDQISQRNDNEHRHGRQRMGTTLVMALARDHEIYITHVGDSRAYWITRTGCHQVTLDDDVASRDVRLGYALYRDALQQVSSGSLVQALGMSPSASLHPTVQRFVLDEDCVFLLCSDGLSDYDRVEQCWETEILPILDGIDVATAAERLIEIANTQNGHDNVTVGLVYCQVSFNEPESMLSPSLAQQIAVPPDEGYLAETDVTVALTNNPELPNAARQFAAPTTLQPKIIRSEPAPRRFFVPVLLGTILVLSLGGLAYCFKKQLLSFNPSLNPSATPNPVNSSPAASPVPSPAVPSLEVDSLHRIKSSTTGKAQEHKKGVLLRSKPQSPPNKSASGFIPAGAIVQVTGKPTTLEKDTWLPVKVCPLTSVNSPPSSNANLVAGKNEPVQLKEGWIRSSEIEPLISPLKSGKCPASTPASKQAVPATAKQSNTKLHSGIKN